MFFVSGERCQRGGGCTCKTYLGNEGANPGMVFSCLEEQHVNLFGKAMYRITRVRTPKLVGGGEEPLGLRFVKRKRLLGAKR